MILNNFTSIDNKLGTALGMSGKLKNTRVIVLPGVPEELKQMFNKALNSGILDTNPVKGATLPKMINNNLHRRFEPSELRIIFKEAGEYRLYYEFLNYTGLRTGDVSSLRYSDINRKKSTIVHLISKAERTHEIPLVDYLIRRLDTRKDKTPIFLEALKANDSIVFDSVDKLKFNTTHAEPLMQFLKTFDFPENKIDIKYKLIKELALLEHPNLETYLEQLYDDSYSDPEVQIIVLNSFFRKNTTKSYEKFIQLLNKDLPLDEREITNVLNRYNDSLSGKKQLFPELLQTNEIKAASIPFSFESFKFTKRFQDILKNVTN